MALTARERATVVQHLVTLENLRYIRGNLKIGNDRLVLVPARRENFDAIQWWLQSMLLISADEAGVEEARQMIASSLLDGRAVDIVTALPPPLNVEAEKAAVLRESAHQIMVGAIHVQLDIDQNKHQPNSVPIGSRGVSGQKFGEYATKTWHETHTMKHMADWAKDLPKQKEGDKEYHGQAKRIQIRGVTDPVCFEGYCVTLGGVKYVSFHCYPNDR